MIKVLVVGMTPMTGGVESVIMNYFRNIDENLCQFDFLSEYDNIAYQDEILKTKSKILKITSRRKSFFKHRKSIKEVFKNNKYDAIWVNLCTLSNIECLKIAKKYNVKVRIIHSHNSENMGSKLTQILHNLNKKVIRKYATDFWACSDLAGKFFYNSKIMNSKNYKIINNAIDLEKFKFNEEIRQKYRKELNIENKFVIGHVGRFHFQKNHEFLIKVFYELQKLKVNAVLLLIGDGEDKEKIIKQINDLGLKDKVKLLGIRKDVNNLFMAMDCMIFPSLFEGLSVSLLEAQATGLPIYSSNTVAKETKVNNNFNMLSLEDEPKQWEELISKEFNTLQREQTATDNLKFRGYDIKEQVKNFVELIKEKLKEE